MLRFLELSKVGRDNHIIRLLNFLSNLENSVDGAVTLGYVIRPEWVHCNGGALLLRQMGPICIE